MVPKITARSASVRVLAAAVSRLFRITLSRSDNPYLVVGEPAVRSGQFYLRHVTVRAILPGDRTSLLAHSVTRLAFCIVIRRARQKLLVGIVTRCATDAPVVGVVTPAVSQPVGLEADIGDAMRPV